MYVIFPVEELILMTYGASIPRIAPRPTLDCLREPKVPIYIPVRSQPKSFGLQTPLSPTIPSVIFKDPVLASGFIEPEPVAVPFNSEINLSCLPPRPSPLLSANRGSLTSLKRAPSLQRTPQLPPKIQTESFKYSPNLPPKAPMYNDLKMRAAQQQEQQQQQQQQQGTSASSGSRRPTLERGTAISRGSTPLRSPAPLNAIYDEDEAAGGGGDYAAGSARRERSPSILLELAPPDPTQPRLGPGWGRPMSPMDLPPEKSSSSRSPKLLLKPKLHIPLGKLGRSVSSEPRESNRLREDLQLHVENPIFNTENLRQRNFDVFFDAGEPVYKLQPKSPLSAPTDSASGGSNSPPLSNYAGVYDPLSKKSNRTTKGGLFARSPREERALAMRSKSTDHYEDAHGGRSASLGAGGAASTVSGGGVSGEAGGSGSVPQKDFLGKFSSGPKSRSLFGWRGPHGGSLNPALSTSMASYTGVLKDYGHISLNEAFKSQNNVNFKLIKTVSDFTETLSHLYEEHATALQTLVSNYRKKNGELRKERPACHLSIFQAWETFLQEVETDSQASNDVASVLSRQVSRPMLDKSFHRKVQSRKIFTHRESFETIIAKTEEKLSKCRLDYKQFYMSHRQNPTQHTLTEYIDAHNAYVQQLHATNAMLETYHCETVPQLMQELEEIHNDLYSIIADSILNGADCIANKASDQSKRYNNLTAQCTSISPTQDLQNFVHILALPSQAQKVPKRAFAPPQPPGEADDTGEEIAPILRNELVFDRHSSLSLRSALESLKREAIDLEMQIRQLQDAVDTLNRTQIRGIEGQLYNKVNEMQEDLSMKKFDLHTKQLHLAAIKTQKELFVSKVDPGSPRAERKLSAATAPSMKTKWLKAIKSLKPASGSAVQADRRNGAGGVSSQPIRPSEDGSHHLQEYTYKKITACDVCSQILRGHTRQGLRCRICKLNAHGDCAGQLPRCQPKQKLLRRQKSTSELENRIEAEEEIDEDTTKEIFNDVETANDSNQSPRKFRQKTPFIDRITKLADKSVQNAAKGPEAGSSQADIPIVNVPDYPERTDRPAATGSSATTTRVGRPGVRPPPVPMPILGVQLQQQELQRSGLGGGGIPTISGGALPVPTQDLSSSSAPHSPRKQKLNLRMKSLSLDSPESSELHGQMRRRQQPPIPGTMAMASSSVAGGTYYHGGSGTQLEHSTPPSNNSRLHSPSSPSHQGRKLLYATRGMRGGSVDLPDDMDKSQSSASTSPCPSPVRYSQKSHRLLPTNLYVVLYNFKARHADELDLKAGYKVTVIDTSDPDWWKGKAMGRVGYFPSKYVVRLNANEKPLQVTHNLQVSDGERGENMTLLRDQIVIQTGNEMNGMVMVRSADNRQGYCPVKYLQEV
ncbi:SH3 and cysteine-rich domain-containing protein isoform 4-T4 [Glossina fuscipes fuscipes]